MIHHQLAVDISFLDRLFVYRQKIRHTAINAKGTSRPSAVVTWVDELLVKINDALKIVSWGGTLPTEDIECSSTTRSIESQKRHDVLRAVIQLPERFFDVHVVVGSVNFSPAAKRIAMSLLFATYVVGPQIKRVRAWPNVGPTPSVISSSLHFFATHISSELYSPSHAMDLLPRRVMAAMSIALFSVVDRHTTDLQRGDFVLHELRPEGHRHLLDLIRAVLNQATDSYMPIEWLDLAQAIILYWGNVLPWSWSTWDDQRIADTEYLSALTATWLYHLDTPLTADPITTCKDACSNLYIVKASNLAILASPFSKSYYSRNNVTERRSYCFSALFTI
ncbi:hypothetical protein HYPSUDRAFT_504865 [Hypholoma sublateritium FD-334 SS-4]|uniref:Uncharacterized protein n=1 Tax=Hypholoma sublateritium (strain FD-334 SS-4) TaxID=945553 RepID=A0A0D2PLQ3_HYPSF|nr:hypothetical protein HYPSUDRAFT_504865 [Hypholoma sublateritium FD-334 SS-4]